MYLEQSHLSFHRVSAILQICSRLPCPILCRDAALDQAPDQSYLRIVCSVGHIHIWWVLNLNPYVLIKGWKKSVEGSGWLKKGYVGSSVWSSKFHTIRLGFEEEKTKTKKKKKKKKLPWYRMASTFVCKLVIERPFKLPTLGLSYFQVPWSFVS